MSKTHQADKTETTTQQLLGHCQRTRWTIVAVLASVATAAAGGIITVLLGLRGDTSYIKGQVDILVHQHAQQPSHADNGVSVASERK